MPGRQPRIFEEIVLLLYTWQSFICFFIYHTIWRTYMEEKKNESGNGMNTLKNKLNNQPLGLTWWFRVKTPFPMQGPRFNFTVKELDHHMLQLNPVQTKKPQINKTQQVLSNGKMFKQGWNGLINYIEWFIIIRFVTNFWVYGKLFLNL